MLAKKYRLTSEFFKGKRRAISSFSLRLFNFKVFPSSLNFSRFAAIAPVSVFKNSVKRNLARRKIFDAVRKGELYNNKGKDVTIYLKEEIIKSDPKELTEEVQKISRALGK
jgi:ribonuclease P protein component